MKDFATVAMVLLSVVVGLPCLCLGVAGVMGSLADVSYAENVKLAAPYLAGAVLPAMITIGRIRALRRPK